MFRLDRPWDQPYSWDQPQEIREYFACSDPEIKRQPWSPIAEHRNNNVELESLADFSVAGQDGDHHSRVSTEYMPSFTERELPPDPNPSPQSILSSSRVWEIATLALSAGTLVAIIIILASADGKPQSTGQVSLNSIISWLSTISRACVLFSISENLGQLKWVWYAGKRRPISDFRTFDSASRGIYGSLRLIWDLRGKHFATWGAIAIILALAYDPFIQNSIYYYPGLEAESSYRALLSNSSVYDGSETPMFATGTSSYVDPVLKANVYSSLFNLDAKKPWSTPQYICETGNCTWPPVAALEMRALCANITENLQVSCTYLVGTPGQNCSVALPDKENVSLYPWVFTGSGVSRPAVLRSISPSDASVYKNATFFPIQYITARGLTRTQNGMLANFTSSTQWDATECSLEPVVRSSRAEVSSGKYEDETLAVWSKHEPSTLSQRVLLYPPWGLDDGMQEGTPFKLTERGERTVAYFLQTMFSSYFETNLSYSSFMPVSPWRATGYPVSDTLQALIFGNMTGCGFDTSSKLDCLMTNVAEALSKTFRDSTYIQADSSPAIAQMSVGSAFTSATYISVHWKWITLPVIVWAIGVLVYIGTEWKYWHAQMPKWNNNPLPLLFLYRPQRENTYTFRGGVSPEGDFALASDTNVQLYKNNGRFVLGG